MEERLVTLSGFSNEGLTQPFEWQPYITVPVRQYRRPAHRLKIASNDFVINSHCGRRVG
jgi:hypothetical protein